MLPPWVDGPELLSNAGVIANADVRDMDDSGAALGRTILGPHLVVERNLAPSRQLGDGRVEDGVTATLDDELSGGTKGEGSEVVEAIPSTADDVDGPDEVGKQADVEASGITGLKTRQGHEAGCSRQIDGRQVLPIVATEAVAQERCIEHRVRTIVSQSERGGAYRTFPAQSDDVEASDTLSSRRVDVPVGEANGPSLRISCTRRSARRRTRQPKWNTESW